MATDILNASMSASTRKLHNRIALVEDHARLATLVERGLVATGIAVDTFGTLASAWHGIADRAYAVVVVDPGLPDGDGLDLVRRLRAVDNRMPCLMLTSRDALRDRVNGLDAEPAAIILANAYWILTRRRDGPAGVRWLAIVSLLQMVSPRLLAHRSAGHPPACT